MSYLGKCVFMSNTKRNIKSLGMSAAFKYDRFKKIDGRHPLKKVSEECFVDYPARAKPGGKIAFFNYKLAREIGLLPKKHPNTMNPTLEKEIFETFGIVIVNEFDQENKPQIFTKELKPHNYMATRYLQLQHPNKQGKTSGDGRSIWNGTISTSNRTYDISSCGVGVTCLSPATHLKETFFETGDESVSYGCGSCEIDEAMATLFFSEIMHSNGVKTERVLAILDYGKNLGIAVRVHDNLIRPSHFFAHLKQDNHPVLKDFLKYYIDRQVKNSGKGGEWHDCPQSENKRHTYFLEKQSKIFAKMAAQFEDDYIFCWLDWDGDNILMDGGIIDYGSVRQFGLFHHEYRYDDVKRFSTTISEQKQKARYIVQTFCQMIDFISTGKKRPIKDFAKAEGVKIFDQHFRTCKINNILKRIGFNEGQAKYLAKNHASKVEEFIKVFHYFEAAKSSRGIQKVADGISWDAIFCMRDILRELPSIYLSRSGQGEERASRVSHDEFIEILKSNYALPEDLKLSSYRRKKIDKFQSLYTFLIDTVSKHFHTSKHKVLLEVTMRSSVINRYDRVTGDSITVIIEQVMSKRPKCRGDDLYKVLNEFTRYQNLNPDAKAHKSNTPSQDDKLIRKMMKTVMDYREGL